MTNCLRVLVTRGVVRRFPAQPDETRWPDSAEKAGLDTGDAKTHCAQRGEGHVQRLVQTRAVNIAAMGSMLV